MRAGSYRTHRQPRWPTAWSAASDRSGLPLFLASYPSPRPSASCTRPGRSTSASATHVPGRGTRSPHRCGSGRGLRRLARRHDPRVGPGVRPQSETIGLAVTLECQRSSSVTSSGPDRPRVCDQGRASRPACWRCSAGTRGSGADHRAAVAVGLLATRPIEAVRIATKYRRRCSSCRPYLRNGSEPWLLPLTSSPAARLSTGGGGWGGFGGGGGVRRREPTH